MKKLFLIIVVIMVVCSSCGVSKSSTTIVDYNRMLFSNGEYTTLVSTYKLYDTVDINSVQDGVGLLCGNVYVRNAMRESCGIDSLEKTNIRNVCALPHLIIPSLNIDQLIATGTFNVEVPVGTYDIILICDEYYPIHLNWEIKSQHKYVIDFYMGCTVLH